METTMKVEGFETNNHEPPSSSTSLLFKQETSFEDDEIVKKVKKKSKPMKMIEAEVKNKSINDLPPEMLMKILKNLDIKNLLVSRLVNRSWDVIASDIFRSGSSIEFYHDEDHEIKKRGGGESLKDFMNCFAASKNSLFTRFCFFMVENSTFDNEDWIKFLSDYEEHIKCLKLVIRCTMNDAFLIKLIENLRTLLLAQLPFLEEFGLKFHIYEIPSSFSNFQLFPKPQTSTEYPAVQLPHLKVLHLCEYSFPKNHAIILDILEAAVNLQTIQAFKQKTRYGGIQDFLFLQSQGKLHCLQAATIKPTAELLTIIKENSTTPPTLKLKSLDLDIQNIFENENLRPDAGIFLSNIFESSKDTLEKLALDPMGYINNLQLPKFSKLISLFVKGAWKTPSNFHVGTNAPILPPGLSSLDMFPALRSLELGHALTWTTAFPKAICIPYIPTLDTLELVGDDMNKKVIAEISLMCPYLKSLKITEFGNGPLDNFPEVGTAIWTRLKRLQYLDLKINVCSRANAFPAIDSCITGIPREQCKMLYNMMEAQKLSEKEIPKKDLFEVKRTHASILGLIDLKKLTIGLKMYDWYDDEPKPDFKKALTSVSEQYAFNLMENLTWEITRDE